MIRGISPSCTVFLLAAALGSATADTLRVPEDYSRIQSAIDAADQGDVVLVEPGRYNENLRLRDGVDVAGREAARTWLAPDDRSLPTVTISGVLGVQFSNFTLVDSAVGVLIEASSGVDVANVVIDRASEIGIQADGSVAEAVNNVFYRNATAISRGAATVEIANNIFFRNDTAVETIVPGADPYQNVRSNCYFGNGRSPTDDERLGGAGATFGDARFVAPDRRDFHLREGSACIDVGRGLDAIDGTTADAGAYGGQLADAFPFPVARPTLEPVGDADDGFGIDVSWAANESYRVTSALNPGGYRVHYKRGPAPAGDSPDDYDGTEASAGPSPVDVGPDTRFALEGLDVAVDPPLSPRLLDAVGRNEAVMLEWEPIVGADGYRIDYGVTDTAEHSVEVDDVSSHTVTGLENGTAYRFAVTAIARANYHVAVSVVDNTAARHESALSPPASIALGEDAESAPSNALTAAPGPVDAYPPLADGDTCFIATAAFGSSPAPDVAILRAFRDRYLSTHAAGRRLVELYYRHSPRIAAWLERHDGAKPVVRAGLKPIVLAALVALEAGVAAIAALLVLTAALLASVAVRRWSAVQRRSSAVQRRRVPHRPRRGARGGQASCAAIIGAALLMLLSDPSFADDEANGAALRPAPSSPRWMYSIKGGYFEPDLDEYAAYYGDDRDTVFAVSGGYRLRNWLEIAGTVAFSRDRGLGRTAAGGTIENAVTQSLMPLHVHADFVLEREGRRGVPYLGIGIGGVLYRQEIDLEPDRDGRTDLGLLARAGWRWRFASQGSREAARRRPDAMYTRSYVFIEAEHFSADADGIDLGGFRYTVGVRFELEL